MYTMEKGSPFPHLNLPSGIIKTAARRYPSSDPYPLHDHLEELVSDAPQQPQIAPQDIPMYFTPHTDNDDEAQTIETIWPQNLSCIDALVISAAKGPIRGARGAEMWSRLLANPYAYIVSIALESTHKTG